MMKNNFITNHMYRLSPDMIERNQLHPLLSSFSIISVGILDGVHTKDKHVDRFFDREFIMLYCIDGQGWAQTPGGKTIKIHAGDVLFCYEKTYQRYWADESNPWTIAWARFNGTDVNALLKSLKISNENPLLSIGYHEKVLLLIKEMLLIMERGFAFNHILHASNCLRSILSYFSIFEANNSDEPAISRIVDYMNKNMDASFQLKQISEQFGISNDYLIRYFKKQTGYTPMEYFIHLKMQKACLLIATTDKTIGEISGTLGFKDAYYFSRLFRKRIGHSPSEYRNLYKYL